MTGKKTFRDMKTGNACSPELPQHTFHHRAQRPVLPGEAGRPHSQQLLQMALDQLEEGRLTRPPRPVHPATDLHAQPQAGGRVAGTSGRRAARLRRSQVSPRSVPDEVNTAAAVHLENEKLLIRGDAPNQAIKNEVWNQIKAVDPVHADIAADINIDASLPVPANVYEVVAGETLSKIAKKFYGDASRYMKIFDANKDQLQDPDKIKVGQKLKIPD
jgi:nucleoid-associated protein YgaU